MKNKVSLMTAFVLLLSTAIFAQRFDSGSTGADGALTTTTLGTVLIDMADHPDGIYNYTEVSIPEGQTIKFIANQKNRPVVWLVQGDVIINGSVNLNGEDGSAHPGYIALGGPGGWPGGKKDATYNKYQGLGPGGGPSFDGWANTGSGAGHANLGADYWNNPARGNVYGNQFCIPLSGGSGGGAGDESGNNPTDIGGGGGGAILIAASGMILISGSTADSGIFANGGGSGWISSHGAGSGGTVRLVANTVILSGQAQIQAYCPNPASTGKGYVRLEAFRLDAPSAQLKGYVARGLPSGPLLTLPAGSATLSIKSVGGINVGADPGGSAVYPDVDLPVALPNPVAIVVEGTELDDGTSITLRINADAEHEFRDIDGRLSGNRTLTTCTFNVDLPAGIGTLYVKSK